MWLLLFVRRNARKPLHGFPVFLCILILTFRGLSFFFWVSVHTVSRIPSKRPHTPILVLYWKKKKWSIPSCSAKQTPEMTIEKVYWTHNRLSTWSFFLFSGGGVTIGSTTTLLESSEGLGLLSSIGGRGGLLGSLSSAERLWFMDNNFM